MTNSVRCLVLGDPSRFEMRPVAAWLDSSDVTIVHDEENVDLVVVCLAYPDEFPDAKLARLRHSAPLARWVVAQSTWCESIGRNRDVWPHAERVPARWARTRLDAELAVLRGERTPLPRTASRDETWAFDHPVRTEPSEPSIKVVVDSPDRQLAASWTGLLSDAGFDVVRTDDQISRPIVLVFDGDPWTAEVKSRLEERRRAVAPVGVVVPLTMPPAILSSALRAPDVCVVPKLSPAAILVDAVREAFAMTPAAHSG